MTYPCPCDAHVRIDILISHLFLPESQATIPRGLHGVHAYGDSWWLLAPSSTKPRPDAIASPNATAPRAEPSPIYTCLHTVKFTGRANTPRHRARTAASRVHTEWKLFWRFCPPRFVLSSPDQCIWSCGGDRHDSRGHRAPAGLRRPVYVYPTARSRYDDHHRSPGGATDSGENEASCTALACSFHVAMGRTRQLCSPVNCSPITCVTELFTSRAPAARTLSRSTCVAS